LLEPSKTTATAPAGVNRGFLTAVVVVTLVAVTGCAWSKPSLAPAVLEPSIAAEVQRSIAIRLEMGLEADRSWVKEVVSDPASVRRNGILVSSEEAAVFDERIRIERAISEAIQFRKSAGMQADEAWVRAVHGTSAAVTRYDILVTPAEAAELDRRLKAQQEIGPAIVAYGEAHADESAGVYVDVETGNFVAQFTGEIERHREALLSLFVPGAATVEVRRVRWSLKDLDARLDRIMSPAGQAWLEQLGAEVRGAGSRVMENHVRLELAIPAANPVLDVRVAEHFNGEGWLDVVVDVVPAIDLPFGSLELVVVDTTSEPVADAVCVLLPRVRGAGGDDTVHFSDGTGTCHWEFLHATTYDVEIRTSLEGAVIGEGEVVVPARQTLRRTISVDAR